MVAEISLLKKLPAFLALYLMMPHSHAAASFDAIPQDVKLIIFTQTQLTEQGDEEPFFSMADLARFEQVSRKWQSTVASDTVWRKQAQSYFPFEPDFYIEHSSTARTIYNEKADSDSAALPDASMLGSVKRYLLKTLNSLVFTRIGPDMTPYPLYKILMKSRPPIINEIYSLAMSASSPYSLKDLTLGAGPGIYRALKGRVDTNLAIKLIVAWEHLERKKVLISHILLKNIQRMVPNILILGELDPFDSVNPPFTGEGCGKPMFYICPWALEDNNFTQNGSEQVRVLIGKFIHLGSKVAAELKATYQKLGAFGYTAGE